jgi:hypothetical protein
VHAWFGVDANNRIVHQRWLAALLRKRQTIIKRTSCHRVNLSPTIAKHHIQLTLVLGYPDPQVAYG